MAAKKKKELKKAKIKKVKAISETVTDKDVLSQVNGSLPRNISFEVVFFAAVYYYYNMKTRYADFFLFMF